MRGWSRFTGCRGAVAPLPDLQMDRLEVKMIIKRLEELKDEDLRALFSREMGIQDVLPVVNEILMEVGSKGDEALFRYTEKFEGASWTTCG